MDVWDKSPLPPPQGATTDAPEGFDAELPAAGGGAGDGSGDDGDGGGGDGGGGDGGGADQPRRPGRSTPFGLPVWVWLLLGGVGVVAIIAIWMAGGSSDDEPVDADVAASVTVDDADADGSSGTAEVAPTTVSSAGPEPDTPTTEPAPSTTEAMTATTEPAPSTTEAMTATTEPAPTTTEPAPTTTAPAPTTTEPAPTTTAPAPSTTEPAPSTTAPPGPITYSVSDPVTAVGANGEELTVTPRLDSCSLGRDCLVVAFTIDGFSGQPTRFVCEFSSGARFVFEFDSDSVDPACSTIDKPDSIVVEVGGLRTEPVTITADR